MTIINALLERARGLLTSPDINAQLAAHGLRQLAARFEELTAAIPELEQRYAELVGEAGRLSELADERRQQLADLDDAVTERLDEQDAAAGESEDAAEDAVSAALGSYVDAVVDRGEDRARRLGHLV